MTRKTLFVLFLVVISTSMWGQTYSNINNSTAVDDGLAGAVGWGSCITCAGGGGTPANTTLLTAPFQRSPSVDGSSRHFLINGPADANGLWWYKVGPNDAVSNIQFGFWVYFSSATSDASALEFDAFQFINGVEYMFGTQCNYTSGYWDVWNMGAKQWKQTSVKCPQFQPKTWYRLNWAFHRTNSNNYEHYDSLTIEQPGNRGRRSTSTYNFNLAFHSGPTPAGWTDNMGVQFQMDIGGTAATMEEWVDEVTLVTH